MTTRNPPNGTSERPTGQTKRIAQLEHRLAMLEGKSAVPVPPTGRIDHTVHAKSVNSADTRTATADSAKRELLGLLRGRGDPEPMIFRKKGFKTQYYGTSHLATYLVHFPETRVFMKDAISKYPALTRLQNDFRALKTKWKSQKTDDNFSTDLPDLLALLPSQEKVRHYLQYFFQTIDTTYHVLHRPSFWKEYAEFWENPSHGRPGFVVTMLLVSATVRCAASHESISYIVSSSVPREQAIHWTKVCRHWLDRQSKKHLNITLFQCRCLWLISSRINSIKNKEIWTHAGALLRFAMSAGFHREPSLLRGRTSVFEQEMRRRLWATIVELELEASLERGMPSMLSSFSFDCAPPLNLKDEDLTDDSEVPLPSQPCEDFTHSAFLHAVQRSLSLRIGLTSQINDLGAQLSFEDVLRYDESIRQELEEIPDWKDSPDSASNSAVASPKLAKTLFEVTLRQYLLLIHSPFGRQTDDNPRYSYSRITCFDTAAKIIISHSSVYESGNVLMVLWRDDIFTSAFTICHHAYLSQIHNDTILQQISTSLISLVDKSMLMLEETLVRLGKKALPCWILAVALSMVQTAASADSSTNYEQQAVERVIALNYRVLAAQESAPWDQNIPSIITPSATGTNPTTTPRDSEPQITASGDLSFEWVDQIDMSSWLPDNLWSMDSTNMYNDLPWA
ncbi:MAG: hypothetical protein M1822_003071 [Bathelium mastoideum]|nr:MAG: hypothetical protein M1822_003071 [Bathelium mastoideum]